MSRRPIVCVQGLGFVGAAMATAIASAREPDGSPSFDVIGIDLPTPTGFERIAAINDGCFPFASNDQKLVDASRRAHEAGNLRATADPSAFAEASIAVMDIHCDVGEMDGGPRLELDGLRAATRTLGERLPAGSLVIVETTVPPGACEKVIGPLLEACLRERNMSPGAILLGHSYERVMPGDSYFDSIVNFWRVYSGRTPQAADVCEAFLSKVINVARYPLTRLHSTTASETAKVLENSYRATTIAFMEEWGRFAEAVGIDLFQVLEAIKMRPTHSNIRQPGFGVGGYCLTKDPLFAGLAASELFGMPQLDFSFCKMAVVANRAMPLVSVDRLTELLGGSLMGKRVLLAGVSYRPDVGDTRYSPSEIFAREAVRRGANLDCHDPIVKHWPELQIAVLDTLPDAGKFDGVVLAVRHKEYVAKDWARWLQGSKPLILDSDNVLSNEQRRALRKAGCRVESIGRGEGL